MAGLCLSLRAEHPGGESEQREARVAQEVATPEPNLRELFVIDRCLEFRNLGSVQRHARLSPFDCTLFRDLYKAFLLSRSASGLHELDKGGGPPVQVGLSGYRSALDL